MTRRKRIACSAARQWINPGVASDPQDWTTYKANNRRAGSSSATVPGNVTTTWIWTPNHPFDSKAELEQGLDLYPTQPICVGSRVFFGTAAGMVYCLDGKTGKELWNYPTAGRILSAPTFWEGKLYVGSGDGRVYCLDAADGSLAWRYRVATVERRIMVYGHLISAWPVNANVLVQPSTIAGKGGAVAYATAGLIGPFGGTYVCALDARSGKPLWETPLCEPAPSLASRKKPPFTPPGDGRGFQPDGKIEPGCIKCLPRPDKWPGSTENSGYMRAIAGCSSSIPSRVKSRRRSSSTSLRKPGRFICGQPMGPVGGKTSAYSPEDGWPWADE